MYLIVVESPTKAKTLTRFLGSDYRVTSTMGHIRDLSSKKLGVDVEHNFEPTYLLVPGKKKVIQELKMMAKGAKKIYLATDPDREGEAIAWHTAFVLGFRSPAEILVSASDSLAKKPSSRKKAGSHSQGEASQNSAGSQVVVSRIVFHEITKTAIDKALASPGVINIDLVNAQQARRVLDRLVGYKLSPLLWRKIRRGLSAGRVQSVTVRLIVDREREIEKFVPEEYWDIWADLRRHLGGQTENAATFLAKLIKRNGQILKVENEATAKETVAELEKAGYEVFAIEKKEVIQNPAPPFTTSTLQQQAALKLYFSSKRTMRAAQGLYEKGLITYHRTDSLNLASEAISQIRGYINSIYGEKYLPEQPRFYKTKSKVAQEAHEAIRPTDVNRESGIMNNELGSDEKKLYGLIWKRAVACQMRAAIWDQTKVVVQAAGSQNIYQLQTEGKVIKFHGFLKVYSNGKGESQSIQKSNPVLSADSVPSAAKGLSENQQNTTGDTEGQLPELNRGDELDLIKINNEQKFTQPPARYNEASLIKALEEKGIGRPSTYAPTISTIQDRQYVEKIEGRFHPSPLGITVNDFLQEYFPQVMDYEFTAKMEDDLDEIANGKKKWVPVIREFYQPFEEKVSGVTEVAERVKVPTEATDQKCPKCEEGLLVIRSGRFGKFLSCSRFPECKYAAPYMPKLEGVKCQKCGGEVVMRKTRKGKLFYGCANYPKCDWASWRKPR